MTFNPIRSDNLQILSQQELQNLVDDLIQWVKEDPIIKNDSYICREFDKMSIRIYINETRTAYDFIDFTENKRGVYRTCSTILKRYDNDFIVEYRVWEDTYSPKNVSFDEWSLHPKHIRYKKEMLKAKISNL